MTPRSSLSPRRGPMIRAIVLSLLLLSCRSTDKDDPQDLSDSGSQPQETGDSALPNALSVVESVVITPDQPGTDDLLVANVTASDADGDTVSLSYIWFIDGLVVDDVGAELSGELYFDKGQSVTVSVTPHDGIESGTAMSAEPVIVRNSATVCLIFMRLEAPNWSMSA